jgi:lipopolysaccharide/colanic/teichoic acid biosynthesis glycosyltransferase
MIKRIFDIFFSLFVLAILSPLLSVVILLILSDSKGGAFFHQTRVGKNGVEFKLHKFRTMKPASENSGQLTVGMRDSRITKVGYYLRKSKLDEMPQLWNILVGEMSVVGPRPEVPKYVALYNAQQRLVLTVKPGLTDYASIKYVKENEILEKSSNPEQTYIDEIMPEKLALNIQYIREKSMLVDLKIIINTALAIIR